MSNPTCNDHTYITQSFVTAGQATGIDPAVLASLVYADSRGPGPRENGAECPPELSQVNHANFQRSGNAPENVEMGAIIMSKHHDRCRNEVTRVMGANNHGVHTSVDQTETVFKALKEKRVLT
ncbi:hypothetical protein F53441_9721 [Fusarium austroafricanum]|uniref:Uncharacterized protein n=1 Tax=Fusarium austroafricanum TaxID=2364996 RepID=A0A8H4KCY0_9HYPO|nr:hypothetical protein F53441_9721 [Fusarium austroafricanum]